MLLHLCDSFFGFASSLRLLLHYHNISCHGPALPVNMSTHYHTCAFLNWSHMYAYKHSSMHGIRPYIIVAPSTQATWLYRCCAIIHCMAHHYILSQQEKCTIVVSKWFTSSKCMPCPSLRTGVHTSAQAWTWHAFSACKPLGHYHSAQVGKLETLVHLHFLAVN